MEKEFEGWMTSCRTEGVAAPCYTSSLYLGNGDWSFPQGSRRVSVSGGIVREAVTERTFQPSNPVSWYSLENTPGEKMQLYYIKEGPMPRITSTPKPLAEVVDIEISIDDGLSWASVNTYTSNVGGTIRVDVNLDTVAPGTYTYYFRAVTPGGQRGATTSITFTVEELPVIDGLFVVN